VSPDRKSRTPAASMEKGPFRSDLVMSPLHIARKNLHVVSSRLRRSAELATRLKLEGAQVSAEDYVKRLRRRKAELTKQIQELSKGERAERSASAKARPYRSPRFTSQPLQAVQLDSRFVEGIRQFHLPCIPLEGDQDPYQRDHLENRNGLHHDSTASFGVDEQFMDTWGTTFYDAQLDDDAAFWRDDDPDWYSCVYVVYWKVPPLTQLTCDGVMVCTITCYNQTEFHNAADDGGGFELWFGMGHTDPDGNWPDEIAPTYVHGKILDAEASGSYRVDYFTSHITFPVKKRVTAEVAVWITLNLWAQDGTVEALGEFGVHNEVPGGYPVPPKLNYTFIPG